MGHCNYKNAGETNYCSSKRGFTLIELLIVLAIVGILAALAIGTMISQIPKYRLREAGQNLAQAFQIARILAIRRNEPILFYAAGNDNFYTLCVDSSADGVCQKAEIEKLLINAANGQSTIPGFFDTAPDSLGPGGIVGKKLPDGIKFGVGSGVTKKVNNTDAYTNSVDFSVLPHESIGFNSDGLTVGFEDGALYMTSEGGVFNVNQSLAAEVTMGGAWQLSLWDGANWSPY